MEKGASNTIWSVSVVLNLAVMNFRYARTSRIEAVMLIAFIILLAKLHKLQTFKNVSNSGFTVKNFGHGYFSQVFPLSHCTDTAVGRTFNQLRLVYETYLHCGLDLHKQVLICMGFALVLWCIFL